MSGLLLYDADCGFCSSVIRLVPRLRLRVATQPIAEAPLAALGVSATRAETEIPFVDASGHVSYGHDAIAAALQQGPWPARLGGRLITTWPISTLAGVVYRLTARHRHRLPGGTPACRP